MPSVLRCKKRTHFRIHNYQRCVGPPTLAAIIRWRRRSESAWIYADGTDRRTGTQTHAYALSDNRRGQHKKDHKSGIRCLEWAKGFFYIGSGTARYGTVPHGAVRRPVWCESVERVRAPVWRLQWRLMMNEFWCLKGILPETHADGHSSTLVRSCTEWQNPAELAEIARGIEDNVAENHYCDFL